MVERLFEGRLVLDFVTYYFAFKEPMQQDVLNAIVILGIGMTSVFAILALIVILGRQLIYFVNRITPDLEPVSKKKTRSLPGHKENHSHIAAINAVVDHLTNGAGSAVSIQRIN